MKKVPLLFMGWLLCNALVPSAAFTQAMPAADSARLRQHLRVLTTTPGARNYRRPAVLDSVARYLAQQLRATGARDVHEQPYQVNGHTYRNIVGSFGPAAGARLVVGAHYDVCGEQPGADDNGSGVAALLELARLLGSGAARLTQPVELVAYTLEEPPFFRTEQMGSYVHAAALHAARVPVRGMVALETLGYFDDRPNSQRYPIGLLRLFYGSRGNYVTVAQRFGNGRFGRQFARRYQQQARVAVRRFKSPAWLPGVDFSDHLNYWKFGYPALLITDTAFYRNTQYHEAGDTLARLDLHRLAQAVDALVAAVEE